MGDAGHANSPSLLPPLTHTHTHTHTVHIPAAPSLLASSSINTANPTSSSLTPLCLQYLRRWIHFLLKRRLACGPLSHGRNCGEPKLPFNRSVEFVEAFQPFSEIFPFELLCLETSGLCCPPEYGCEVLISCFSKCIL